MQSSDFQTLSQNLQRPINCLLDPDRYIRKQGLEALLKSLKAAPRDHQLKLLESTHLAKNLIHTLSDPIENNRELTLNIWEEIVQGGDRLQRELVEPLLQSLIARINATPYPEKSQDLREKVIQLLRSFIQFKDSLVPNMGELAAGIAKCLGDPSSSIKILTCDLLVDASLGFKDVLGKYSLGIIKALNDNLQHNKYQVRKKTLFTISRLLITSEAGSHLQHLQVRLKSSLSDPKGEVRKAGMECVAYLLNYMAPKYLKQYEALLVSYLLVGLSDQNADISQKCKGLLGECGANIQKLVQQES